MVKTTVYLPEDLKYALRRVAGSRGQSEAEVIRTAIQSLVEAEPRPRAGITSAPGILAGDADEPLKGDADHPGFGQWRQTRQHRRALGFLSAQETEQLGHGEVLIPDPGSTLVCTRASIGAGTVLYPTVILDADESSVITIGERCRLYPGVLLEARDGARITIGDDAELGPGGVTIRVAGQHTDVVLGPEVRLSGGCELTGSCQLGVGAQILGAISARSVRLAGGRGGHRWPDPDERGAVLKGAGLADGIELGPGEVRSCRPSFGNARTEQQTAYHPAVDQTRS